MVMMMVGFFTAKLISGFSAVSYEVSKLQCLRANAFILAAFSSTSQKMNALNQSLHISSFIFDNSYLFVVKF